MLSIDCQKIIIENIIKYTLFHIHQVETNHNNSEIKILYFFKGMVNKTFFVLSRLLIVFSHGAQMSIIVRFACERTNVDP